MEAKKIRKPRKKLVEKDYGKLIKDSEEKIAKLTEDLKAEKANKKQLEKEKVAYDAMIEKQKRDEELKQIAEIVAESGKSLDEVKKLLSK